MRTAGMTAQLGLLTHVLPPMPAPRLCAGVLALFCHLWVAAAASSGADWPRRLGYWRFDSTDWRNEENRPPVSVTNVSTDPGIDGLALRIPSDEGPAWFHVVSVEHDGRRNFSPVQGAIRFLYKPQWRAPNLLKLINSPMGTMRPPRPLRLIEAGWRTAQGWVSQFALSVDGEGRELILQSRAADGHTVTNLVAAVSWPMTPPAPNARAASSNWREIVINYSATHCALVVDGALQQDQRRPRSCPCSHARSRRPFIGRRQSQRGHDGRGLGR